MTETVPAAPAPRTWKLVKTPLGDVDLPAAVCDQHELTTHHLAFHGVPIAGFDQAVADVRAAGHAVAIVEYDTGHNPWQQVTKVETLVGPFYQSAQWIDGQFTVYFYSERYATARTTTKAAS